MTDLTATPEEQIKMAMPASSDETLTAEDQESIEMAIPSSSSVDVEA